MEVETDLLIIGTGPAGASLACFLASYGLHGIMLGDHSGSIAEPRAHITNMAALECLRDVDLETECLHAATKGDICMQHTRWCHDMTGEEYARLYSWGNDPARKGDYDAASPCSHVDLPQTRLEPILVRHAQRKGFTVRFDSEFLDFRRQSDDIVLSTIKDKLTGAKYSVRSRYLFSCDGARSRIMRQLGLPLIKRPGQGLALNVLVKCDLSAYMKTRTGNLHWIFQPDIEAPSYAWSGGVRMVKPWYEWLFILLPLPGDPVAEEPTQAAYTKRVKDFIGDDSIPFEILDVSRWNINETVAERYSEGNIFCLGDAVHRHPPFNGLGSNTCIQDAFNLAWKIAYTIKGQAGPSLLDSYNAERQPIGERVITRANQGLRDHGPVMEAFGMLEPSLEARMRHFNELSEASPGGAARRARLQKAIEQTAHEFHGLGVEMNQDYKSGAVYTADEAEPRPRLPEDPVLYYQITTYPGSRLPHAWLNTKVPKKPLSTIDLAGHGAFCLLTGIGGEQWKDAAAAATKELGVEVRAYSIGWRQDYEDVYFDWTRRREVEEDGCVLVRPDRTVAWRSTRMVDGCQEKLLTVLRHVLCL